MDLTDLRTPQSAPCLSQRSQCTQNDSLESDTYSAHDSAPRTRSSFSMLASPRTPASGHDVKLDLTTARRRRRASHRARTGRERTSGVPRSLRNSILELHTGRARPCILVQFRTFISSGPFSRIVHALYCIY